MGSAVSWEHQDAGSIPGPAQLVKNLPLPHLRLQSKLWLEWDPRPPGTPNAKGEAKKENKKERGKNKKLKTIYVNHRAYLPVLTIAQAVSWRTWLTECMWPQLGPGVSLIPATTPPSS